MSEQVTKSILVVDFGAQYAQLIARHVRETKTYSEVVAHDATIEEIKAKNPTVLVSSGNPSGAYAEGAPKLNPEWLEPDIPVFGICYGFQAMTEMLGGTIAATGDHEYDRVQLNLVDGGGVVHTDVPETHEVWMSHGDTASKAPEDFTVTASTKGAPVAVFECSEKRMVGVQYYPEANHSPYGQQVLEKLLYGIAGLEPDWTAINIAEELTEQVRNQVGETGYAICGLPGGVDSTVAVALVQRAIGDRLTCVFVDHGLLCQGEREQVEKDFVAATGAELITVDDSKVFLDVPAGITNPETKRKAIGREFIRSFGCAVAQALEGAPEGEIVDFLVQGTLYSDVVGSSGSSSIANIKNHYNAGGLPDDVELTLVESLRLLPKGEIRTVGRELGLPEEIVACQPLPGPGPGIRIISAVDEERPDTLRHADAIVREEMAAAGMDEVIWQRPIVLPADVRSVDVRGDGRTYSHPVVLRPVSSEDAMIADWTRVPYDTLEKISTRITNEVPEVNRVVLDVISKPPGTIEWG